jgi:PAS domain S-box-containing protein
MAVIIDTSNRPRILAIDDTPANLMVLGAGLSGEFSFQMAISGADGLAVAESNPPDLVLLDVMMPQMDGFETCRRFKANPKLANIPIVFITALSSSGAEIEGLSLGATDYLHKPINVEVARQRIHNLIEREALRREVEMHRDHLSRLVTERTQALEQTNAKLQETNDDLIRSRDSLKAREAQLRVKVDELGTMSKVLDKAPFGITFADPHQPDMPLTYVNTSFEQQTGYSAEQALGRNCRFLQGPDTQPEVIEKIRRVISDRDTAEMEILNYRRNGEQFWNRLLIFPSFDSQGNLLNYVGCQTDITAMKMAAQERHQMEAELFESMKLQSLGLTIAGIAHDLNTPIGVAITASSHMEKQVKHFTSLTGATEASRDELIKSSTGLARSSALIINNLNKAATLVRSFKQTTADASRTEWRKLHIKSFLESLLTSVSPVLNRARCEVELQCPDDTQIHTEPGSLMQALVNLIVNATIHAFDGRTDRHICITVTPQEEQLIVEVADNGIGMSQEALSKAFTPFFTTNRGSGGSGLGLFSSRRVVEEVLGGRITVTSQAGQGTRFQISLPTRSLSNNNEFKK